jgi:signal transduction histidine kinase
MQTSNVNPGVHTRLLNEQGAVIVALVNTDKDEPVQVPPAENAGFVSSGELRQRSEIQDALQGKAATAVRRVESAGGQRVLYAAVPIPTSAGDISSIVYLASPLPKAGLPPNVILQFVGAVIAAILLAGLAGTLLARGIAHPIEALGRAAKAVSKGDLEQNVPVPGGILELQDLGRTFNGMIRSLRYSIQAKNAFIADVTHELRTPLTVINGTVETLEDGAMDDFEGRGPLLESMQRETDRLIRLVNELLVLTRADASALKLNLEKIDLVELAQLRCKHLSPLSARKGVKFEVLTSFSHSHEVFWVEGDVDRLAQVLDNLLDNAIRHSPTGSTVTIGFEFFNQEIQCTVRDQGPGIPEKHLPFIFERFYRVDSSRHRQAGGTGLGLAIVQALVTAHDGILAARV